MLFDVDKAFEVISNDWKKWDADVKPKCYAIGISGGIDSTCVAALACKIFGKYKVVGVSLPCDGQKDMDDVDKVFAYLGIKRVTIDIGDAFSSLLNGIENNGIELTNVCKTNIPARLRMAAIYGVAQCLGGVMVNTCNRSESVLGNDTLFGDDCGSYAPIQSLTKTEVKKTAAYLGVPHDLVDKTPIDGLQPLTDEERLGISYDKVDAYVRGYVDDVSEHERALINQAYVKNKFKMDIVHIAGPDFSFLTDVFRDL